MIKIQKYCGAIGAAARGGLSKPRYRNLEGPARYFALSRLGDVNQENQHE